jgi:hypothetical protein
LLNVVSDAEPQPATLLRNAGKGNWFDLVSAFLTDAVDKPASLSALRATLVKQLAANEAVTKDAPATKK